MFLNSETDYAIRIVACLAEHSERLGAGAIADFTGVTPRYALKILHKLSLGGIVKSYKGAYGGYVLARPSGNITLLEVIELMCGPINLSRCQCDDNGCTHPQGACYFRETLDDVSIYMRNKFKSVTFSREG